MVVDSSEATANGGVVAVVKSCFCWAKIVICQQSMPLICPVCQESTVVLAIKPFFCKFKFLSGVVVVFNGQNRRRCRHYDAIEGQVVCNEWIVTATFAAQRYCKLSVHVIICLPMVVFCV